MPAAGLTHGVHKCATCFELYSTNSALYSLRLLTNLLICEDITHTYSTCRLRTMHAAVAAVEVAAVDVLNVVTGGSMPQLFLVLTSWVACIHLRLVRHVQQIQVRVLYALYLHQCHQTPQCSHGSAHYMPHRIVNVIQTST